jgi:hypothetical protein
MRRDVVTASKNGAAHKGAKGAQAQDFGRVSSAKSYYALGLNNEALDCVLYDMFANSAAIAVNEAARGKPEDAAKAALRNATFRNISLLAQALHDTMQLRASDVSASNTTLSMLDLEISKNTEKKDEELANTLTRILGSRYGLDIWIRDDITVTIDEIKGHITLNECAAAVDCLIVAFVELYDRLEKSISKPRAGWVREKGLLQQELVRIAIGSMLRRSEDLKNSENEPEAELGAFDYISAEKIKQMVPQ